MRSDDAYVRRCWNDEIILRREEHARGQNKVV